MSKLLLISNLRLGEKVLAVAAGDAQENGSSSVPSAWAALRAAHARVGLEPESIIVVTGERHFRVFCLDSKLQKHVARSEASATAEACPAAPAIL